MQPGKAPWQQRQGAFFYSNCLKAWWTTTFLALLLGALAFWVYLPGLGGQFFFDDVSNLLKTDAVRLNEITLETLHAAWSSGSAGPSGRPIAQISFAFNYYFTGFSPYAFKATNLVIHTASALLVFFLALRILGSARPPAKRSHLIFAAAALAAAWLLHPIQLLPVLHVVQRMTSLSALFLLAALISHIHGRQHRKSAWLVLAWFVFWPLSFFSKESGVLFPLFALAWELILNRWSQDRPDRFARLLTIATSLACIAAIVYSLLPAGQWLWAGYTLRGFSLVERLLTESRVIWFYLGLILFPRLEALGLYHDDIVISSSLTSPWTTTLALGGIAALFLMAWRTRRNVPLLSLGIAWFFIGHLVESTALPLEIAHEHRNYLPLFGVLLPLTWCLQRMLAITGSKQTICFALTTAAVAYFGFITALRSHQFGDDLRRTQIEAQHHRASSRAQFEAGRVLALQPEAKSPSTPAYSFAKSHFELSGDLDPNSKMPWLALIHLNCAAGEAIDPQWISELTQRLLHTPFAPGDQTVLYALKELSIDGSLCLGRNDVEGLFSAALANHNVAQWRRAILHSWHADYLWLHEHDMAAARSALSKSLELNRENASNRLKWAQLVFLGGEHKQAKQLLLSLRDEVFSADERKTLTELLAGFGVAEY